MYRFDPHVHTVISSRCGKTAPKEIIAHYKNAGFHGICVTDHFYLGNTSIDKSLPWPDWVHDYCNAYREVKKAGEEAGIDVFFGWETTYDGEDFLIYGLDETWLTAHPEITLADQKRQYELVQSAGGFVVQAHPMRERRATREIRFHPYHCDAVEIANAGNRPYMDRLALVMAETYGKKVTAGSDFHREVESRPVIGVECEKPIRTIFDYRDAVLGGQISLFVPEGRFTSEAFNPILRVFVYDEKNRRTERPGEILVGAPKAAELYD